MHILIDTLKKLTDRRWLNLFEVEYEHESGKRRKWQFASRKPAPDLTGAPAQPDAVFVVPILKTPQGNRLVILKEFRVPLGDYEYTCPAGLIEPGEPIAMTVHRELTAENGLD